MGEGQGVQDLKEFREFREFRELREFGGERYGYSPLKGDRYLSLPST